MLRTWQVSVGDLTYRLQESKNALSSGQTEHRVWELYDLPSSALLATFSPPQRGVLKAELTIYDNADAILSSVVLAVLLISSVKSEWRNTTSVFNQETLGRTLHSRSIASLPPYSRQPISSDGRRSSMGQHILHSNDTTSIIGVDPPAYASRSNISSAS